MTSEVENATDAIRARLRHFGVSVVDVEVHEYPQETAFIVFVDEGYLHQAVSLGNELDGELANFGVTGFVAVRTVARSGESAPQGRLKKGVQDERADQLGQLITARARTSATQPSLAYVPNATANVATVTAPRHHLIFGRRGAGKTALMVEAKRQAEEGGAICPWVNIQTYRRETVDRIFLWATKQLCDLLYEHAVSPYVSETARATSQEIERQLGGEVEQQNVARLIPRVQQLIQRFQEVQASRIYLFLDDFYYIPRQDQPLLLDMLHGCVRDCDAWLKVASIKHLSRWFQPSPPVGLQTGQDADHIDLDVTLEDPLRAKAFLEEVLHAYAIEVNVPTLSNLFSSDSLDRLVLASGAVPRDYLVLSANAVRRAQTRENARLVGVQDVNAAAGDAARSKISELEDDLAASGSSERAVSALAELRSFCLEEKQYTYFAVDFKDKERQASEYDVLTDLMDVRLVHLVNSSVSDDHRAGERSEVFMLDLSQFSGQRLKKFIRVLDFVRGNIVLKQTGKKASMRVGNTPKSLLGILRRAPKFDLVRLSPIADGSALTLSPAQLQLDNSIP